MELLKRYLEIEKVIEEAKTERKEIGKQIIAEYAPFQVGDKISDGGQVAIVDILQFLGIDKEGHPRFSAEIYPFKPDGTRWQRRKTITSWDMENWCKTDQPVTTDEKLARWKAQGE